MQIVNSNAKYKILRVVVETKQSNAVPFYHEHAWLNTAVASYSLFACHMMLATSILTLLKLGNIFKPFVQLAHAHTAMSCIHLVYVAAVVESGGQCTEYKVYKLHRG